MVIKRGEGANVGAIDCTNAVTEKKQKQGSSEIVTGTGVISVGNCTWEV